LLSNADAQRKMLERCRGQAQKEGRANDPDYIEELVEEHLQGSIRRREKKMRKGLASLFQSPEQTDTLKKA